MIAAVPGLRVEPTRVVVARVGAATALAHLLLLQHALLHPPLHLLLHLRCLHLPLLVMLLPGLLRMAHALLRLLSLHMLLPHLVFTVLLRHGRERRCRKKGGYEHRKKSLFYKHLPVLSGYLSRSILLST